MSDGESRSRDREKARRWKVDLEAGAAARQPYDQAASMNMAYYEGTSHAALYEEVRDRFLNFTEDGGGVGVSINKLAQLRAVLCPYLAQRNPARRVLSHTTDRVFIAQNKVLEAALNYSLRESDYKEEARSRIDDSMVRGLGWARSGWDPVREVVTSWAVDSLDVLIDPAAKKLKDARWQAQRRKIPIDEVKRWLYPDRKERRANRWRFKDLKPTMRGKEEREGAGASPWTLEEPEEVGSSRRDLLECYEIWSKRGSGLKAGPEVPEDERGEETNRFVKLVIAKDHPFPLYEGPWEGPLYLDDRWPLTPIGGFVPALGKFFPDSQFGLVVALQKGVDLYSTLALHGGKAHGREVYVVRPEWVEEDDLEEFAYGGPTSIVRMKPGAPPTLRAEDVFGRVDMGSMSPEIPRERQWLIEQMEQITGATSVLHGGTEAQAQERSATASAQKLQAANTRIDDLVGMVEDHESKLARNELLLIRLGGFYDPEDLEKMCQGVELGWLVSVRGVEGELAVRDRSDEEELAEQLAGRADRPLTVEELEPKAGTYFETEEEAWEMAQLAAYRLEQLALGRRDPRALSMWSGGVSIDVRKVTVDDVWRDTAGQTPREVARECYAEVVSGTTQRPDKRAQLESADIAMQQGFPPMVKYAETTGDWGPANKIFAMFQRARGVPPDEIVKLGPELPAGMPAPPMGAPAPALPGAQGGPPGGALPGAVGAVPEDAMAQWMAEVERRLGAISGGGVA